MPEKKNPSLKDPKLYEELRDEGASKQKAARISNAAAQKGRSAVGRKGGKAGDYDDWTVPRLRERAQELGLTGYLLAFVPPVALECPATLVVDERVAGQDGVEAIAPRRVRNRARDELNEIDGVPGERLQGAVERPRLMVGDEREGRPPRPRVGVEPRVGRHRHEARVGLGMVAHVVLDDLQPEEARGALDAETVRALVRELLLHGLVSVAEG